MIVYDRYDVLLIRSPNSDTKGANGGAKSEPVWVVIWLEHENMYPAAVSYVWKSGRIGLRIMEPPGCAAGGAQWR